MCFQRSSNALALVTLPSPHFVSDFSPVSLCRLPCLFPFRLNSQIYLFTFLPCLIAQCILSFSLPPHYCPSAPLPDPPFSLHRCGGPPFAQVQHLRGHCQHCEPHGLLPAGPWHPDVRVNNAPRDPIRFHAHTHLGVRELCRYACMHRALACYLDREITRTHK